MGKISYEDIDKLRPHFNSVKTKIPTFMQDIDQYKQHLERIVQVNNLEPWLEKLRSSPPPPPAVTQEKVDQEKVEEKE